MSFPGRRRPICSNGQNINIFHNLIFEEGRTKFVSFFQQPYIREVEKNDKKKIIIKQIRGTTIIDRGKLS